MCRVDNSWAVIYFQHLLPTEFGRMTTLIELPIDQWLPFAETWINLHIHGLSNCVTFELTPFVILVHNSNDLSFASTETKYIKLKTKTQNNIFGFSSKKWFVILAFFEKIWLKYEYLQKNQQF